MNLLLCIAGHEATMKVTLALPQQTQMLLQLQVLGLVACLLQTLLKFHQQKRSNLGKVIGFAAGCCPTGCPSSLLDKKLLQVLWESRLTSLSLEVK